MKERQRGSRIKGVQRGADEVRGKPVVMYRGNVEICKVAAAVAGGEQLASHPGLPLQQRNGMAVSGGGQGGHEAGGAAADDDDIHGWLLSPRARRWFELLIL